MCVMFLWMAVAIKLNQIVRQLSNLTQERKVQVAVLLRFQQEAEGVWKLLPEIKKEEERVVVIER